jgi:hypothetical protein
MREQAIPEDGNLRSGDTCETDIKEVWFIGTHSGSWVLIAWCDVPYLERFRQAGVPVANTAYKY